MFPNWKTFAVALGAFASTCPVEAQSPALSVTFASPDVLQFSWPGNFTNWQLMTTANLAPATWQTVPLPPFASNSTLTVLLPVTESKRYFRLQETGAGSCVFHATPPVINSGQSSTLSRCPLAGYTYRISSEPGPGPGVVSGNSLVVLEVSLELGRLDAWSFNPGAFI